MKLAISTGLKQFRDSILGRLTNKKGTIRGAVWSGILSLTMFTVIGLFYLTDYRGSRSKIPVLSITITPLEFFAYGFLLFSWIFPSVKGTKEWRDAYGIGLFKTQLLILLSLSYCIYPTYLFNINYQDFFHNVVFTAMVLVETVVTVYAGFDILNLNNLRWFLRTWPYSATGILVIQTAFHQMQNTHHSTFFENNSLANAVFSFITITYFVQVFNERFCKKQGDESIETSPINEYKEQ